MTVVLLACGGLLLIAAVMLLIRITVGPTMLDRTIAVDVMIAIGICGAALEAAYNQHTSTLPMILVLTLLGFVSSVSVARFTTSRRTSEEAAQNRGEAHS